MTYFPDLSEYAYELKADHGLSCHTGTWGGIRHTTCLNVGWLDSAYEYPRGEMSEEVIELLFEHCKRPCREMRGFHDCQFCLKSSERHPPQMQVQRNGENVWLGDAEIRVLAADATLYAAPNMIYHYVTEHQYLPPQPFIEALFQSRPEISRFYRVRDLIQRALTPFEAKKRLRSPVDDSRSPFEYVRSQADIAVSNNDLDDAYISLADVIKLAPKRIVRIIKPLIEELNQEFADSGIAPLTLEGTVD
jgi:hypothetical protein